MGAPPAKVLVVDDEEAILASTAALLRDMGYAVATCSDAARLRATLERESPDVVLQDVRMPGFDLVSFVLDLRRDARWRQLPFVVFTASMDVDDVLDRIGARVFLEKPFRPKELEQAIHAALAET